MNGERMLRLASGVRLRCEAGDAAFLLVPEGVVELSSTARAILELVDGRRTVDDIISLLAGGYDAPSEEIAADVAKLCDVFVQRGFLQT